MHLAVGEVVSPLPAKAAGRTKCPTTRRAVRQAVQKLQLPQQRSRSRRRRSEDSKVSTPSLSPTSLLSKIPTEIQEQNAVMLQDEEPKGASHDKMSQPNAGPLKKMAVKGQPLS